MLGSYAVSDWEEGSPIMFLSSGDCGMYSVIETKILNKQMSFRHLGEVINGEKIAKDWGKVTENYYLKENGDSTQLKIAMNSAPEFEDYMKETFPKAIAILKEICETQPKL